MKRNVVIIHYNTPELTEAAIMSLRKHGGGSYQVYILDNSDYRPFTRKMEGVKVLNNRKGRYINFEKELAKYPEKDEKYGCAAGCWYGSDKHMMSVQKMWELVPDGFVLMDSDVLIRKSIDFMFMEDRCACGYVSTKSYGGIPRYAPMLLWINVPLCVKGGARFFDPDRAWALHQGHDERNFWDTGAAFLDDIKRLKPQCVGRVISRDQLLQTIEHYGSGSWKKNELAHQAEWLGRNRALWDMCNGVAVCAIGRGENRYAREWVEHYKRIGVSKIFLYENNRPGEEQFIDVLRDYVDSRYVELIPWTGLQRDAYEDCYRRMSEQYYGWIGFLDFDEFVQIDGKRSIHQFLSKMQADCVVLNWREMTDSGLVTYDERPVVERFGKGTGENFQINRHVKCFVRTGMEGVTFMNPHCPTSPAMVTVDAKGERVAQTALQERCIHHPARVDHYDTKTADEYVNVKWKRGTADGMGDEKKRNAVEYFFSINERTAEKEKILSALR